MFLWQWGWLRSLPPSTPTNNGTVGATQDILGSASPAGGNSALAIGAASANALADTLLNGTSNNIGRKQGKLAALNAQTGYEVAKIQSKLILQEAKDDHKLRSLADKAKLQDKLVHALVQDGSTYVTYYYLADLPNDYYDNATALIDDRYQKTLKAVCQFAAAAVANATRKSSADSVIKASLAQNMFSCLTNLGIGTS